MNPDYENALRSELEHRVENLVLLTAVDSTHGLARRLIEQMDADDVPLRPTLVVAAEQTGGRGRNARRWQSPPGGLYLSWVSEDVDSATVALLPMLAATAAHRALAATGLKTARIKWPNDILVNGRKIAGLIIHARHGDRVLVTVGLGVNITVSPELGGDAVVESTSVAESLGPAPMAHRAAAIAAGFMDSLSQALADTKSAVVHWRKHLVHELGDPIKARLSSGEIVDGRFAGVSESGHLRIEELNGVRTLSGGDIIEG